jgi:hypothetical protein
MTRHQADLNDVSFLSRCNQSDPHWYWRCEKGITLRGVTQNAVQAEFHEYRSLRKSQQGEENCTMRSFTICCLHYILLEWPNQWEKGSRTCNTNWMNELARNPVTATASSLAGLARVDLARGASPGEVPVLLQSPSDVTRIGRWKMR